MFFFFQSFKVFSVVGGVLVPIAITVKVVVVVAIAVVTAAVEQLIPNLRLREYLNLSCHHYAIQ